MFSFTFSVDFLDREKVISFQKEYEKKEKIQVRTSGSTGQPKEITISLAHIKASAHMTNSFFNFKENNQALMCLSIDTIAGKMMLARAMEGNYTLKIIQPIARPLENSTLPLNFVALVPAQLHESLLHDAEKLKAIDVVLVGGGPISEELEKLLIENQITVYHSFGMTETLSHVAIRKVGAEGANSFEALSGVHFSEQNGNLVIDAPHLGVENLLTNDQVKLLSNTKFEWLGRTDFVINTGGYKIQIEDLENRLSTIIPFPFFIWKENHDKWGEIIILCVENDAEINPNSFTSTNLFHSWEKPKKTHYYAEFSRSESGKILRKLTFEQKPLKIHEPTS